jgi:hypothetical protein
MGYAPTSGDTRNGWDWNGAVIETWGDEVSVEDLTIEFGPHSYKHHAGQGFNGIMIQWPSRNCWVRDVAILNADDAILVNGYSCTVHRVRIIGGHHIQIAYTGTDHNLAHDLALAGGSHHGLTGNWGANHSVFSWAVPIDGRGIRVEPDHNGPHTFDLLYQDVPAPPPPGPTLTLRWVGVDADRVGGYSAAPDGALDGHWIVRQESGGDHTLTSLEMTNSVGGVWRADGTSKYYRLSVHDTLEGPAVNQASGALSVYTVDGQAWHCYGSDYQGRMFTPGVQCTLVARYADGSVSQAQVVIAATGPIVHALDVPPGTYDAELQGHAVPGVVVAADGRLTLTLRANG